MKRFSWSVVAFVIPVATALSAGCSSSSSNAAGSACDHYYSALESDRCGSNIHSDQRKAQLQATFHDVCIKALAEPGVTFGPSDLDACASAFANRACTDPLPDACKFKPGTLDVGAGCLSDSQCSSGYCARGATLGAGTGSDAGTGGGDAGARPDYCGTCGATIPDGGACTGSPPCITNDTCDPKTHKCVAIVKGKAGDTCDFSTKQCDTGLSCNLQTMKCVALGASGDACVSAQDCQSGLMCAQNKCAPKLAEGAACTSNQDCAPPLGCDPTAKKCAKHPIAQPGQSCDTFTVCDFGTCRIQNGSGTPTGSCPNVIAAGGACSTTTSDAQCDDFTSCIDGKCQSPDANLCK